jgi:hypothetical protein
MHIEIVKPFLPTCSGPSSAHKAICLAHRFLRTCRENLCFTTFMTTDGSPFSGSLISK